MGNPGKSAERIPKLEEFNVWNKLKARHYSILILAAIVTFETSAIAIDRYLAKTDNTAFEVVGHFRNNNFIDQLHKAEVKSLPIPGNLAQFSPLFKVSSQLKSEKSTLGENQPSKTSIKDTPQKFNFEKWIDHTVAKGESLSAIAGIYGSQVNNILSANNFSEKPSLKAGQKIKIPVAGEKFVYSVKSGDSLSKIASRFGISLQEMIRANNLKSCILSIGQKVEIPLKIQSKNLEIAKVEGDSDSLKMKIINVEKATATNSSLKIEKPAGLQIVKAPE